MALIGCGSSPSGTPLGATGLVVVLPAGAQMRAIEQNSVYLIDWKDQDGKANRAVVSLIGTLEDPAPSPEHLIRQYELGMLQGDTKFKKLSDIKIGAGSRRLVYYPELKGRQGAVNTTHLILGRKIAEVILLHPGTPEPSASQKALAASISGFE